MPEVWRDGAVHVRASRCDNCLFSKDRLVDGARARAIIEGTRDGDAGHFICHLSQVSDEPDAICKAWWDAYADENWVLRAAKALKVVEFVGPAPRTQSGIREGALPLDLDLTQVA